MNPLYPPTYYAATAASARERPAFGGTARADVVVVGGGYTGLSAALHLAGAGAKTILLEAERVAFAASGRNGGQIHSGQRQDQATLEAWFGEERAQALWRSAEEANALVRALIAEHKIPCAVTDGLIVAAHDAAAARDLREEAEHLATKYGCAQARFLDRAETEAAIGSSVYHGSLRDAGGGHLHPLNYALGLAEAAEAAGVVIHEGSRVLALEPRENGVVARVDIGMVAADRVILACDAFASTLAPELAGYLAHIESYIVATARLTEKQQRTILPLRDAVADTRHVLDYYRLSEDHRLLFAGGETYFAPARDIAGLVRPHMLRVYPELAETPIDYAWRGTVAITRSRLPHFGRLLGGRALFAHGYSGQGVALATLGGKLAADAALGESEGFELYASLPAKPFPGGALLMKPLTAAALAWFKLKDAF